MRLIPVTLIAISCLLSSPLAAQSIKGRASVIDGDTIEIAGQRIRLFGIDAPESSQLCRGDNSLQYQCGAKAANDLDAKLDGQPVTCTPVSTDRYNRTVATCIVGGNDIGAWMVEQGLALDWPQYSRGRYSDAQRAAERAGRGLWSGSYAAPWLYRACIRAGGRIEACSDNARG